MASKNSQNKSDPKINNQSDIDNYIDKLISQSEKEIETLFAKRFKTIKQEIADMFEKYQSDDVHVTWTEFNKYNRLNKELDRIAQMLTDDYSRVAKTIKQTQQNAYIEKFMMSLYLYEMASQTSMQFDVPNAQTIQRAIEQPIEFIKLVPTLQKHRDEVLKKIRLHITQGIISGEGYSKIAKALRDDIGMTKAQSTRVARTEAGRVMSQAGLDSATVAQENGLQMYKYWYATKDTRTRDTHRHLDGSKKKIDEPFKSSGCVGQAPKLFVGVASAKENINCRCKLMYYISEDDLPTTMTVKKDNRTKQNIPFVRYRHWERMKREQSKKKNKK
ncbi:MULTISPECIES: phage head morphogenesis protein [Staphylococcus]|uniref:phage head morphogenesis protein n=1 Tax=Staphylococcus TaxID=1279 RepID=UPI00076B8B62|nr:MULTISPECIES: phage head morphogenesis protein [Staphylococcus]DAH60874.1 MAG TPA: minor capsid protein [Caudoviricetes sp.]AMG64669.1 phage head morphogenesis protein [Staphylococcus lugdunensis]MCH8657733.1 phage head morphogenesis protein [Staphylococcus lugdunensis]MCH8668203.1 phage head morphogenesis protein [Staphylococcus lugdunensis]MCI2813839.1 phage head morphogenesis protein [Staphylococcus lugdunensis]